MTDDAMLFVLLWHVPLLHFDSRTAADTRQAGSLSLSISVEDLKINDSGGAVREREAERGERGGERERGGESGGEGWGESEECLRISHL